MRYEQQALIPEELTSSWGALPAKSQALLESALELATLVIGGPSSCESFATLGPDGYWLKTFQGYSQLMMDGSLETFSGNWPKRGMMLSGNVGELPTWGRHTRGSGCSLWPTPTINGNYNRKGASEKSGDGLATAVAWPTPTTRDYKSPDANPESNRFMQKTELNTAVLWATPTANDNKPACAREIIESKAPKTATTMRRLRGQATEMHQIGMALNPDWVEALMGLLPGWTKLPPSWKAGPGQRRASKTAQAPNTTGSLQE